MHVSQIHRCDSHRRAGGPKLPDHRGDEGGDEEAQQPVHRPEEVQQLCLLEEEEEEVVYACNSSCMNLWVDLVLFLRHIGCSWVDHGLIIL